MEEDSWDAIDWDEKITHERQTVKEAKVDKISFNEEDGNYYEINQEKKLHYESKKSGNKHIGKSITKYVMPYSFKELKDISGEVEFYKVIFKIYGDLERFLMTHDEDLPDDFLVELVKLDVRLLQVPFKYHNQLFINRILKIERFWHQVILLIKNFYEKNNKDPKYLLFIDMKGFFENIEYLIYWLVFHNYINYSSEITKTLISTIENFSEDENLKFSMSELKSFENFPEDFNNIYEVQALNLI